MLYGDLGINSHRKGNALLEMFSFYRPSDFNGVVKEWLVAQRHGGHGHSKAGREEAEKTALGRLDVTTICTLLCAALVCIGWMVGTQN